MHRLEGQALRGGTAMTNAKDEWNKVMGLSAVMTVMAFLLPVLCFGRGGGQWERLEAEPVKSEEEPALLMPLSAVEEGEWTPLTAVTSGELDGTRTVRVLGPDGEVREQSMSDYLWGVVAAEMPASFELEALKAQAAAARSPRSGFIRAGRSVHTAGTGC